MNNIKRKIFRLGPNQKKALLIVSAGIGLSLSKTPNQYFRVIKEVSKEWKKINKQSLERAIQGLYKSKLIEEKENLDGSLTMVLTEKGKRKVITFNIDDIKIKKPSKWDKKWRMVIFDIPEKHKKARDALREILKKIGFYEFQKSVFIYPYECIKEIDFIIEYFDLRLYVRIATSIELDNEVHLRKIFNLA